MHALTYPRHIPLHPSLTTDNITCVQLWQQGVRFVLLPFLGFLGFSQNQKTKKPKTQVSRHKNRKTKVKHISV